MSHIVIDGRESGTTTGRYIDKMIENLHKLPDVARHKFTVLVKDARFDYMTSIAPNFEIQSTPYKEFTFGEQLGFKKQIRDLHADLVHFPIVQQPVLYHGRTVTTMNDLTTIRFRNPTKNQLILRVKQQIYKWVNKRIAHKATRLITYSEFVRDDIASFTHVSPNKITAIPLAGDAIPDVPEPIQDLIDAQYIMYIGRPMPHKNLERLIDAFVLLKAQHPQLRLVLAGRLDANYQRIRDQKASKIDGIIFTDFITDGQLRWLYEHCAAYVFPSLSEGFGLPGLEAMAHDAPVVSSNATCLPEVYGDAAHYFDPLDVQDMADRINEVLTDQHLRTKLIENGQIRVKKYSWRKTAEETLEVYDQALNN